MKYLLVFLLLFSFPLFGQIEGKIEVPYIEFPMKEGKGQYSTKGKCNMCHSFGYIINQGNQSKAFWRKKTIKMIETFSAPIADEDIEEVVNYLYENYGDG